MAAETKNQKIYQQVVEQIQEMLLNQSLKKGDRLPSERDLSEKFKVSRSSVREAVRALEIIGIVESRQGGGNYIRSVFDQSVFQPLSILFKLNNGSFSDILEYRMIFEPELAALAAKRISAEDSKILKKLMDDLKFSKSDEVSAKLDQQIHVKIIEISGNDLLLNTMHAISSIMASFIEEARQILFQWHENREELLNLHCRICQSIIDHEPELARTASKEHFKFLIDKIFI